MEQAARAGCRLLLPGLTAACRRQQVQAVLQPALSLVATSLGTATTAVTESRPQQGPWKLSHRISRGFATQTPTPASAASSALEQRVQEVNQVLSAPPCSLYFDRGQVPIPPELDNSFGRGLMQLMGFYSKKSQLMHGGQRLYEAIREAVDSGAMQKAFQTGKVFWSSYVLLSLHTWLIIHRLRTSTNPEVKFFRQRFYMQFQQDVEVRVYAAGVQVGVSKWLKKLEQHFYDTGMALDQVLTGESKESLDAVLLRSFYGGEARHAASAKLMARYLTRELQCLAATDEAAIFQGHVRFSTRELAEAVKDAGVTSPSLEQEQDEAAKAAAAKAAGAAGAAAGTKGGAAGAGAAGSGSPLGTPGTV